MKLAIMHITPKEAVVADMQRPVVTHMALAALLWAKLILVKRSTSVVLVVTEGMTGGLREAVEAVEMEVELPLLEPATLRLGALFVRMGKTVEVMGRMVCPRKEVTAVVQVVAST